MTGKKKYTIFTFVIAAALILSGCKNEPGTVIHGTTDDILTSSMSDDTTTGESVPPDTSSDTEQSISNDETTYTNTDTDIDSGTDPYTETDVTITTAESEDPNDETSATQHTTQREPDPPRTTTTVNTTSPPATAPPEVTTTKVILTPSPSTVLETTAPGVLTEENKLGTIDYSNTSDGYIMVKYTGSASKVKVQVSDPKGTTQTYNLNISGKYEAFPLTGGNGKYSILLAENISGTSYAVAVKTSCTVTLSSQFAPYLRPNQYVNYVAGDVAVKKASDLCAGTSNALEKVDAVYTWLVENVSYDKALAEKLGSGYLPDTSKTINKRIGICLDYAGTAAAMLRSQNVPTQLVVGYAGTVYHAWISVYVENVGWVHGAIYFDGTGWKRMDPTFDASADSSSTILEYIGNGTNYKTKYLY